MMSGLELDTNTVVPSSNKGPVDVRAISRQLIARALSENSAGSNKTPPMTPIERDEALTKVKDRLAKIRGGRDDGSSNTLSTAPDDRMMADTDDDVLLESHPEGEPAVGERAETSCQNHIEQKDMSGSSNSMGVFQTFHCITQQSPLESARELFPALSSQIDIKVLSEVGLVGRDDHIKSLRSCYREVCQEEDSPRVVLIKGKSGCGKTRMVNTFRKELSEDVCFVSGKYNQYGTDTEHFLGLGKAFSALCVFLEDFDPFLSIRDEVIDSLTPEGIQILGRFVPELCDLFEDRPKFTSEAGEITLLQDVDQVVTSHRFRYLMRSFLRSVCSSDDFQMILFLDDVHWSDDGTLELVHFLAQDPKLCGCIFILAYRDNEIPSEHKLSQLFSRGFKRDGLPEVQEIEVGELSKGEMNEMLVRLMKNADEAGIERLANAIWKRTDGNPYFAREILQTLLHDGHITNEDSRWSFKRSVEDMVLDSEKTMEVIELVSKKIKRLPPLDQRALNVGACLGASFDVDIVAAILAYEDFEDQAKFSLKSFEVADMKITAGLIMRRAVSEGLVEKAGQKHFRFLHDKIQQSAYQLLKLKEERESLHFMIGSSLRQIHSQMGENGDWMLFLASSHLYLAKDCLNKDECLDISKFIFDVSRKAIDRLAFSQAQVLLQHSVSLLEKMAWDPTVYAFSVDLYSTLAEIEFTCGKAERCISAVKEILANAKADGDTHRAYFVYIACLGGLRKKKEALDVAFKFLGKFGVKMNPKPSVIYLAPRLFRMKALLRTKTDEHLRCSREMTDQRKVAAMRVLGMMVSIAWWSGDSMVIGNIALQMVSLTQKYGHCRYAPLGYCLFAVVNARIGHFKTAERFGTLAIEMASLYPNDVRTSTLHNAFIAHVSEPLHRIIEWHLAGYKRGIQLGDPEYGLLNCLSYAITWYHCGLPLHVVSEEIVYFGKIMKENGQVAALVSSYVHRQAILNLMGESFNDPHIVQTGEAIGTDRYVLSQTQDLTDKRDAQTVYFLRMQLAHLFGEHALATEMATKHCTLDGSGWPIFYAPFQIFWRGMVFYEASRTRSGFAAKRYNKRARGEKRKLSKNVNNGMVNCYHLLLLLEAEDACTKAMATMSLRKKKVRHLYREAIRHLYSEAIKSAARSGFTNIQAVGCERAAMFANFIGDQEGAKFYLSRSRFLYGEWGAHAKVTDLELNFPEWPVGEARLQSNEFGGRHRRLSTARFEVKEDDQSRLSSMLDDSLDRSTHSQAVAATLSSVVLRELQNFIRDWV